MDSQDTATLDGSVAPETATATVNGSVAPESPPPIEGATTRNPLQPPSAENRKRLREMTQKPPARRKRTKKSKVQLDTDMLIEPPIRKLDRKTRWMTLLNASNVEFDIIIREVYGDSLVSDGYEWKESRNKIFNNVKSYKNKVIDRVIVEAHVKYIIAIEKENRGLLPELKDTALLFKIFAGKFKKKNFFKVFYYMEGYVDIDESSELGKWYLQNLYANLAVRAKWHVDYMEEHTGDLGLDSRQKLLDFYATMTTRSEYDTVDKSCFVELFTRSMREKPVRKFKPKKLPDVDPDFYLSSAPPAKAMVVSAAAY